MANGENSNIIINGNIKLVWGGSRPYAFSWVDIYQFDSGEYEYSDRVECSSVTPNHSFHIDGVTIFLNEAGCLAIIELVKEYYRIITYERGSVVPKYGVLFKYQDDNFMAYYDKYSKMFDNLLRLTNK